MHRKRYKVGQRFRGIPVSTLNSLSADVDRLLQQTGQTVGPALESRGDAPSWLLVPVRNMTGLDLVEYAIAGVDVSAYTLPTIVAGSPDQNTADAAVLQSPALEIVSPNATTHAHKWVVVLSPLANGASGWAVAAGLVPVRINQLHADHAFARPATGDAVYLQSGGYGAPVWFRRLAGTGKQWGLVQLGASVHEDRYAAADPTDARPATIYEKVRDFDSYNATNHQLVYAQVMADPSPDPVLGAFNTVRLFTLKASAGATLMEGCGIDITDSVVSFDAAAAAAPLGGLYDVTACTLAVDYGCGLTIDAVGEFAGKLRVNTGALAGVGLVPTGGSGQCAMQVNTGLGLTLGTDEVRLYNSNYNAGLNQLYGHAGGTFQHFWIGCGLERDIASASVRVRSLELAGAGLVQDTSTYTCGLGVNVGLGVFIIADAVSLSTASYDSGETQYYGHESGAFKWLTGSPGGGPTYTAGCGITIASDTISVDNTDLVGAASGLDTSGSCGLAVDPGLGIQVDTTVEANGEVALFRTGYSGAANQQYVHHSGAFQWVAAYTVKATANDSTASYLHDAINDNGTYVSGQDPLVKTETVGAGGTDQKERLFFDSSAVDAWTATDNEVLGHTTDGAAHWFKVDLGLEVDTNELQLYDTNYNPLLKQLYGHATGTFQHFEIGCGLEHHVASSSVRVNAAALAGDGLDVDTSLTACGLKVVTGLGVYVITDAVSLSTTGYSSGLTEVYGHVAGTFQHFEIGCGLTVVGGVLKVDTVALNPGGSCALSFGGGGPTYTAGCGITIASDTISVDNTDLVGAGSGLDTSGSCGLAVDPGLGIQIDTTVEANGEVALHRTGYSGSANQQYVHHSGTFQFVAAYQVKCTVDDSTASYLHDAIKDNATYVSGSDAIVASATDGAAGTNQKERLFVDVSVIAGYTPTSTQLLGHVSGALQWKSIAEWLNLLAGYNGSNAQSIGHPAVSGSTQWQDDFVCT